MSEPSPTFIPMSPEDLQRAQEAHSMSPGELHKAQNGLPAASYQDGADITLPVEYRDVTNMLPSKGVPYPKGTRWHVRPYYFDEVLSISEAMDQQIPPDYYYDNILKGITAHGCPVDHITLSDFYFLNLYRKAITLGETEFTLISNDAPDQTFKINIEQLHFKDLSLTQLPIKMKLRGEDYEFSPIRYCDYVGFLHNTGETPSGTDVLALSVRKGDPSVIYKTYGKEVLAMRKIDTLLDHGLEPISYIDKGGKEIKIEVDDPSNLLLPFRSSSDLEEFEIIAV